MMISASRRSCKTAAAVGDDSVGGGVAASSSCGEAADAAALAATDSTGTRRTDVAVAGAGLKMVTRPSAETASTRTVHGAVVLGRRAL